MKISRGFVLTLLLLAVAVVGYGQFQPRLLGVLSSETLASQKISSDEQSNGSTEEAWTIMEVCDQIGFLLHPEPRPGPAAPKRIFAERSRSKIVAYNVEAGAVKSTVTLHSSVWDPATYQGWCQAVSGGTGGAGAGQRPDILAELLLPETATFLALDERLSRELAKFPRDPQLHTEAALLLGTMAWFDAAGHFQDVRPLLNRMTAFLAVADALGAAGKIREVAEILRLVLVHDQAGAVAGIAAARTAGVIPTAWLDALEVTATADWRKTEPTAAKGPMLVQLAHFRVLTQNMSANKAESFLRTVNHPSGVSWGRFLTQAPLGIRQGHMYSRALLGLEVEDANAVAKACGRGSPLKPREAFAGFLIEFDGLTACERPPESRVVGLQLWAGRTQRHFLQAAAVLHDFLQNHLGVPEQAAEFNAAIGKQFSTAFYFPFLTLATAEAGSAHFKEAQTAAEKITRAHPASVAPQLWAALQPETPEGMARGTPDFHRFYNPEVPRHTSYDAGKRIFEIGVGDENSLPLLKGLLARCPYDYAMDFQTALVEGRPNDIETKRMESCMRFADISKKASDWVASAAYGNPQRYERLKEREAEGDPDAYIALSSYFEARQDMARAEKYLLLAHGKVDSVLFANACGFFVEYCAQHGRMNEAERLAKEAAETYSSAGLSTWGWLQEYRQQWAEASKTYRAIDERYGRGAGDHHLCYTMRRKLAGEGWHPEYQAGIDLLFPRGLEKVSLASLGSAPPRTGVCFSQTSERLQKVGLGLRDVVVGIDGVRVENLQQYTAARSLSESPDMVLLVCDGHAYEEVKAHQPGRRFGVDLRTFQQ